MSDIISRIPQRGDGDRCTEQAVFARSLDRLCKPRCRSVSAAPVLVSLRLNLAAT